VKPVFGRKSYLPASLINPILNNKACCSFLLKGIELPPRQSMWWVVLLEDRANFEYLNSLSLRDTHRLKKQNIETPRTFAVKWKKSPSVGYTPAHWLAYYRKNNDPKYQTKYGIELPTSVKIIMLFQLKIWAIFKHINSLLAKRRMIGYFQKTCPIYRVILIHS
jgi:hypothetical protein